MRTGIFLSALLATALFGGTALAERTDSDARPSRGQQMKQRVLEKQREGFKAKSVREATRAPKQLQNKADRIKPRGEIYESYGNKAQTRTRAGSSAANHSATGNVNTPAEIRAMLKRINPMFGAYRTAAGDGTDSYGGTSMVPNGRAKGADGKARNMSATGAVNTPSEVKQMLRMINPMHGAYRTAAGDGTDSYGGEPVTGGFYSNSNVVGGKAHASKYNHTGDKPNQKLRDAVDGMIKARAAKKQ